MAGNLLTTRCQLGLGPLQQTVILRVVFTALMQPCQMWIIRVSAMAVARHGFTASMIRMSARRLTTTYCAANLLMRPRWQKQGDSPRLIMTLAIGMVASGKTTLAHSPRGTTMSMAGWPAGPALSAVPNWHW